MSMNIQRTLIAGILMLISACTGINMFGPQSPHALYADRLKRAGLADAALTRKWFTAAERSLYDSVEVALPYREIGYFAADRPGATGIRFQPKRGQKIRISLEVRPTSGARLFAELWRIKGDQFKLLAATDSLSEIIYEQESNDILLFRLQPELLVSVSYVLTIFTEPSLAFPVPGNTGTHVGSFWGDARDAGKRKHEGIDIFDKFRTPVVAAADGRVMRVNENNLGGKTVWLNPAGKSYMLYYAHLDSQIVSALQAVKKGDTLGLMGNTGNARYTPTHLHFGIYENGAVDPLPFVQQVKTTPAKITGDSTWLDHSARNIIPTTLLSSPQKKDGGIKLSLHTPFHLQATTDGYYLVQLPDATRGFIPVKNVELLSAAVKAQNIPKNTELLCGPDTSEAVLTNLSSASKVEVYGTYNDFLYVKYKGDFGWIRSDLLEKR
jgi:murein DD-endopeptidase MepM/ murein hydrolase activator NlpD